MLIGFVGSKLFLIFATTNNIKNIMEKKKFIKLSFQVPHTKYGIYNSSETTYDVKTCYQVIDANDANGESLDKAFKLAASLGADLNKNVKWTIITEEQYIQEVFESIKKDIPTLCRKWGKKNGSQFLYGDVLDWIRDQYNEIYRSSSCDNFARLIIGEFVIKTTAL